MPKTTFAGHGLHVEINDGIIAFLPFSTVLDLMYFMTGDPSYSKGAYLSLLAGYVSGILAAAAGTIDYLAIPADTEPKMTGAIHGLMGGALLALTSVDLLLRRRSPDRVGITPFLLSAANNVIVFLDAWYGGELVFEEGMRVEGRSPIAGAPDLQLPGDEKLVRAIVTIKHRLEDMIEPKSKEKMQKPPQAQET